jgi:class 3 adenylate cyclase
MLEATGDQVICVFEHARDALACAARTRAELGQREWGPDVRLDVRAALHTGRIVAEGHGGIAIVHCLELCATAEPGQVLVSHATEALLEGEVLEGLELRDLGERHLRSFDTPSRVFELMG